MTPSRIDVHCHYLPGFYQEALVAAGHSQPDGMPAIPAWSETDTIETLDRLGIAKAYLSISSPGVHFGDDAQARRLARQVNDEGARLKAAHPDRLDFFAATPLPDVEGAIAEVTYALDELGAAGVVLETNFHGLYLGDDRLAPLYAELDKRHAVLFLHPTTPGTACGCRCARDNALGYPRPMLEFLFDTTRTVTQMVLSGTLDRYPELRVIVPHAGATLPVLAERIDVIGPMVGEPAAPKPPSMREALRRLHFDLAGAPVPELLQALLSVADARHIHYGSDWLFTPVDACERLAGAIDETPLLAGDLRNKVLRGNAEALFGYRAQS